MKKVKKIVLIVLLFTINSYANNKPRSDIVGVSVKGEPNAYHFTVTIKSDDIDCQQYTDWWEVLNKKGELIYRRILIHSHPDQQPFSRSGGYVKVQKDETLYIRAHMKPIGYVGNLFKGSVESGFTQTQEIVKFNEKIETQDPLPEECLY